MQNREQTSQYPSNDQQTNMQPVIKILYDDENMQEN